MKRTPLPIIAGGATALGGCVMVQRKLSKREKPRRIIKETFWSKVRELWAIRRRCREIELQQRQNRPLRSNEFPASFVRRDSRQATNLSQ
jgi:hypothetical protein